MMAQYYIWFRIWWRYSHQKDTICYLQTTYCGHIWTHGCEKTNVGHIEVPLPYSIPTRSPLSAFHDALEYQTLSKLHHRRRSYDVISIFKMAAAVAQFYFRFRIGWRRFLQKVNVYQRTTFRQNNSINGRDITISGLEKNTFTILKFFFRFRPRPYHRNPHDILHTAAKLYTYRTTQCGNMTSYGFFKMAAAAA